MSKLKVNPSHGVPGPPPATFERWIASTAKRGAKRYRVHLADDSQKLVAHKNAPDSAKRITAMGPVRAEALDDKDAELGEWHFAIEHETEPAPGYLKEEGDSDEASLLKTFAHLLADAHRLASRQLVEVVSIQSRHFNEERRNLLSLQLANERLLQKRLRPLRVRVAEGGDGDGEEEEGGADEPADDFMAGLVQMVTQRMMGTMGGHVAEGLGETPAPNGSGESKKDKKP